MRWKVNSSLTQKDTMDGRAWIKNSERKADGGLIRTKVQKGTKVQVHGNEEQMKSYICHMLRSCGVQARNYPKTEVK